MILPRPAFIWPISIACLATSTFAATAEDLGTITATVGDATYTYTIEKDDDTDRIKEFSNRSIMGRQTVTIGGYDLKDSSGGGDTPPKGISIMIQMGTYGMKSITLYDGQSYQNPLESAGMSGVNITFDSEGANGRWQGSFSGTLDRQDASTMDPSLPGTIRGPVDVRGSFDLTVPE